MYTIAITKSYNNLHQPIVAEVTGEKYKMPSPNDPKTITPSRTHARTHRRLLQCGFLVVFFLLIYALDFARAYVDSLPVSRNALILMDVFSHVLVVGILVCMLAFCLVCFVWLNISTSTISDLRSTNVFCALHFAAVAAAAASGCLFCGCPNASVNSFDTSRPAFVPAALTTLLLLPPTDRTSVQLALFLFPLVSLLQKNDDNTCAWRNVRSGAGMAPGSLL